MTAITGLVIFDCDGVLVDSEMIASRVLSETLAENGLQISPAECRKRFTGLSIASVVSVVREEWGRPLPADFEQTLRNRDRAAFERELSPMKGIREAVKKLPLPVCVASSGSVEKIQTNLTLTGLIDLFAPHLFSAAMVARGKPAPDLFLHAAASMGFPAGRCAVVEDSVAGITAARAAGMRAIGFVGGSHAGISLAPELSAVGAEAVITDMADLPGLI
ncbi:MAG: HAD family hydrolase [Rhodospirillales bacterium]|nr:HAD family hydrolase [Rhodospirillales bacterium]